MSKLGLSSILSHLEGMKASLLNVGTEITSGQILNENARELAKRLKGLGITCQIHLSVPDDRALIRSALKICAENSDLIFVTGGLGPTSDDFTRDLIAEWAGASMFFHEPSWKKIVERLTERGLVVHDFQKQQCDYPLGAVVLENAVGTANGFYLNSHNKHLWALPGPPNEILSIWKDHVEQQLKSFPIDPYLTYSWHVLGLGENQLAHLVEPLVQNQSVEVGYRVHLPYVEFKISFFESQKHQHTELLKKVESILAPHTVTRNDESVGQKFCDFLSKQKHTILVDEVSDGRWLSRLTPYMKTSPDKISFTYTDLPISKWTDEFTIHLKPNGDSAQLEARQGHNILRTELKTPLRGRAVLERKKLYFAELAMIEVLRRFSVD